MAVANTKSSIITNIEAVPIVPQRPTEIAGLLYAAAATLEVAAADDDTSVYRFFRVHSSWRVHGLKLWNDAITGGTSYNFGLAGINDGAAVSASLFASAVDLSSARAQTPTDITTEALNIDALGKRIWEQLSLTSDPDRWYDLVATAATVGSGAGTITLQLEYVTDR